MYMVLFSPKTSTGLTSAGLAEISDFNQNIPKNVTDSAN
jgi:hypothetical protein